jgi:hypothetical protein
MALMIPVVLLLLLWRGLRFYECGQRYVARGHIEGGEMRPDYDLSGLEASKADVWLFLRADAIRDEIRADQAERQGFALCGRGELEELFDFFPQPVSPAALPEPPVLICPYAVSIWMH